jgi:hypothetical protein
MSQLTNGLITILAAIIGIATLSVILSKQSNTVAVINSGSKGFASLLSAATAPVTGGSSLSSGYVGGN